VARRAGVSQSTVSLVLSGKSAGRISARTEAAVREAAAELGYRPNVAARALRTGAARTVGLVVTDVAHPFFGLVLRGAQIAAWKAGYAVALVDVANDPDRERASFEALRAGPVDGFIFFTVEPPASTGEFVVAIEVSPPGMPFARLDTEHGTDLAVDHLLSLGHERIGHLASDIDGETFQIRRARLLARLSEAGLEPAPRVTTPFRFEQAGRAARELLDRRDRPTAVFCDDDILAGGVYLAARELGLRIPDDVSVVGFDDLPFAQVFEPPLTTIRIDAGELGATAFELLATIMAGEPAPPGRILPVELVVRRSTGPPRS
jgi:LacI family transcriptional regulator, repressor for deo operon, udp, cdd, tsx, nupC, and nupG